MLDRSAAHRLTTQVGDQESPGGRDELVALDGETLARIEARLRTAVELSEVCADAPPGVPGGRIDRPDLDDCGHQEMLDRPHRGDDLVALARTKGSEDRRSQVVAALVEQGTLGNAGRREPGYPDPAVGRARLDARQAVSLERAQQPAGVARVQAET